jgi:hypothetical protein
MLTMRKAKKRTLQLNAQLAQTLTEKGVEATADETTTALVDKVAEISTGSNDSYYDVFWDNYQQNGNRTNYLQAFCNIGWNETTFQPKYNLCFVGDARYAFWRSNIKIDLISKLKEWGLTIDTREATGSHWFYQSAFETLPTIHCLNGTVHFMSSLNLSKIEKVVVSPNSDLSASFHNCPKLENITIEGEIGKNIAFPNSSLLTNDSVQSIIKALIDLTDTTTQTLTLHKDVKSKLSETQISAITGKNWTLA